MTAKLNFENVTLRYPIYNSHSLSLRRKMMGIATGGRLQAGTGQITQVTALDNVSFSLKQGDAIGIVGHNGAGKSTLLRTMAGIYTPLEGRIERVGRVATMLEVGACMDPELSGYENIRRMGLMLGLTLKEINARIPEIEEFTDLGDFLQLAVRTYSAGMAMRLMFAVATCTTPDILLVDEVFDVGDEAFKERASARMHNFIKSSQIFCLASHSMDTIAEYCNRVFVLSHGTLREIPVSQLTTEGYGIESQAG